jgi:integrase
MARRGFGKMPEIRLHKRSGNGRVFINGQEHWVGRYGSPEAKARYAELIAAYVTGKSESVEAAKAPPPRPAPLTASLTVGELAIKWLRHIEQTRPDYRRSSLWNGAIAASRAVRPFATMAVGEFGSRALIDVQRNLIETPIAPYRKRGRPAANEKPRYRTRRYINDVIGRVRQMFHWGVLQEMVPDDRVKALEIVPALTYGATKAKESKLRQPVRPSVVKATLPHMTREVADLIWFMRLTGCRPSEAGRMKLSRIRDREQAVWRYVPRRHKTAHKGKQRHIPIGPQAQAIVLAHTAGREPGDYVFSPQRSLPPRKPRNGVLSMEPRKASPRAGKQFTKDTILRAVTRAIAKANKAREQEGLPPLPHWTPYQLRYTRLREIRKQLGREAARAVAGHSRATMTDHYAPANWGRAAKAAKLSG